jgi:hypothetical protein
VAALPIILIQLHLPLQQVRSGVRPPKRVLMNAPSLKMGDRYRTLRTLQVCITPAMGLEGGEAQRVIELPAGERFAIGQPCGQPDIAVCAPLGEDAYERLIDPHVPAEWLDDEYYVGCLMFVKVADIAGGCEFLGGFEPEPVPGPRRMIAKMESLKKKLAALAAEGHPTNPEVLALIEAELATQKQRLKLTGETLTPRRKGAEQDS